MIKRDKERQVICGSGNKNGLSKKGSLAPLARAVCVEGERSPCAGAREGGKAGGCPAARSHVGIAGAGLSPAGEERDKEAAAVERQNGGHGSAFCFLLQG